MLKVKMPLNSTKLRSAQQHWVWGVYPRNEWSETEFCNYFWCC